jgi:hypothetical protein
MKKESPTIDIPIGEEHWYERHGKWYPSVTTILGAVYPKGIGFAKWLGDKGSYEAAEQQKKEAAKRGTAVHEAIEQMLKNPKTKLDYREFSLEEWKMLKGFCDWYAEHSPNIHVKENIERVVYDDKNCVAGRCDLRCSIGHEWFVIDYKTSSKIQELHKIQVTKYATMYKQMGFDVDRVGVLRLSDWGGGHYEFWAGEIDPKRLTVFLSCKNLWDFQNPKAGPRVETIPRSLSLS